MTEQTRGILRREDILLFIASYRVRHGYSPTVREITTAVGLRSTAATQHQLELLARRGLIRWDRKLSRTIMLTHDPDAE